MGSNDVVRKWTDIYNEVDETPTEEPWDYEDFYEEPSPQKAPIAALPGMPQDRPLWPGESETPEVVQPKVEDKD